MVISHYAPHGAVCVFAHHPPVPAISTGYFEHSNRGAHYYCADHTARVLRFLQGRTR